MTITPEAFYATAAVGSLPGGGRDPGGAALRDGSALGPFYGFPVHGYTWRALLPKLAETRTCFVLDLPGLGDSGWDCLDRFPVHGAGAPGRRAADRCSGSIAARCSHTTPAPPWRGWRRSRSRCASRSWRSSTPRFPRDCPPWIPLYRTSDRAAWFLAAQLPVAARARPGSAARAWRSAPSTPTGASSTIRRAGGPIWIRCSPPRSACGGCLRYLPAASSGTAVDDLRTGHARIQAPRPAALGGGRRHLPGRARRAHGASQFGGPARFVRIPRASLMPHEERPEAVLASLLLFLESR